MADIIHLADAAIFSLCAAVSALERRKAALADTIPNASERYLVVGAINGEQDPMISRLADLRATSLEAQLAGSCPPPHGSAANSGRNTGSDGGDEAAPIGYRKRHYRSAD